MTDRQSPGPSPWPALTICAVLVLANAFVIASIVRYSRNVLGENGAWVSTKVQLEGGAMGGAYFLATRQGLHRNRLDLGAWHGFQEISLNRVFEPGRIDLDFMLEPEASLSVLFNRDPNGSEGVRLSRRSGSESTFFRMSRAGAFEDTAPLELSDPPDSPDPPDPPDQDDRWHHLSLELEPDFVRVVLDEREAGRFDSKRKSEQFVSLRGGRARVLVDNVVVRDAGGSLVHEEAFRGRQGLGAAFAVAVLVLLILPAAVGAVLRALGKLGEWRHGVLGTITFLLTLLVFGCAYWAFDFWFWSSKYPYDRYTPWASGSSNLIARAENFRCELFRTSLEREDVFDRLRTLEPRPLVRATLTEWDGTREPFRHFRVHSPRYVEGWRSFSNRQIDRIHDKTQDITRLAIIGTSQTVGEGTEVLTHAFGGRLHESLAAGMPAGRLLETFIFAIKGNTSEQLIDHYRNGWVATEPDIVLLNLGNNDDGPRGLRENLDTFISFNERRGIRTILMLEPNSPEKPYKKLARKHNAMRDLGRERNVPVWDLHAYLSAPEVADSGFLWWDDVHLSSYGHRMISRWLASRLRPEIDGLAGRAETSPSSGA